MNNLDKQYTELLQDILDNGVEKKDRTGTGTISVFGRQIRHKMSEGFPLITTKKMYFKGIVTELLWFLKGDTNIKYLIDNDTSIWNGDAYKNYYSKTKDLTINDFKGLNLRTLNIFGTISGSISNGYFRPYTQEEFINKIKTDDEFAKKWGDLGPIYGQMWRDWDTDTGEKIDQIANLINDLKTNPDSRRLMVNAWNCTYIPHMVLPPCHYGFQVYTRELSMEERWKIANLTPNMSEFDYCNRLCDENNVPKRAISLMWNQRSVDTFLGLPFNIASYGLLLEIIAKEVNMIPDELIGNLGDVHLYSNHVEQAKEQIGRELSEQERWILYITTCNSLQTPSIKVSTNKEQMNEYYKKYNIPTRTREPYPLPTLKIQSAIGLYDFFEYLQAAEPSDCILENYQSHSAIKAPLSN